MAGNSGSIEGVETAEIREARKNSEALAKEVPFIVEVIMEKWEQVSNARSPFETRWLASYQDYRGQWSAERRLRDREKSKVFVKIPKTKTLAAQGQINEILFGANQFPLAISETERPDGVAEQAHFDPNQTAPEDTFGYPGDGKRKGEKVANTNFLGGLVAKFSKVANLFSPGPATSPQQVQVSPAKEAAMQMEKTIKDQLTETHASRELRKATLDMALYGTGIVSGPFSYEEIVPSWEINVDDPESEVKIYKPKLRLTPRLEHVSIWDFYPDPSATCIEDCEYVIHRRKMNKSQLRKLRRMPYFLADKIDAVIAAGPNYVKQDFEDRMTETHDDYSSQTRWEVLVYWGIMDKEVALAAGADVSELSNLDEVQVNIWVCNGEMLRVVTNPFEPSNIPFHAVPYEKDPSEFWGVGVPENMSDSTMIMNGHARMAIDNLALSGNLIFDISEDSLVPGQSMEMYAGKVLRRQSGQPGQAVFGLKFPNTTAENMLMFDRFRQFADEETGIPSYSHGQTGVGSTTRTASGMSMLMGAAAQNAKTVVKNVDDYLLKPLGEAFYYWNNQFNPDIRIVGDLKVKAMGTEAFMQKEVKSQKLLQFLQVSSNPTIAPWVKHSYIVKELAKTLDLDQEESVNNLDEAKIYAAMMQGIGAAPTPTPTPGADSSSPMDMSSTGTGNGNIAPANPVMPGAPGFAANTSEQGATNANTSATTS